MSPGSRLPSVTTDQLVRALKRGGRYEVKQERSHLRLRHDDHPADLLIAIHKRDVPRGALMALIKRAGMTQDEFRELL